MKKIKNKFYFSWQLYLFRTFALHAKQAKVRSTGICFSANLGNKDLSLLKEPITKNAKQIVVKKNKIKNETNFLNTFDKKSKVKKEEYYLETFKRSNQDTCLIHKPSVIEGNWVQSGDLLTDCASSMGGELSLGQNLLIAYMPWEGYNFEDAILISERLVIDDLYTSVHIERYELETQQTKLGSEEITRNIPDISEKELNNLDSFGIIKKGSWVEEGDILVGKITPINKKKISPYQKLLYTILEKQVRPIKDSSLRAPKGIKAKVIDIKYFLKTSNYFRIPLPLIAKQNTLLRFIPKAKKQYLLNNKAIQQRSSVNSKAINVIGKNVKQELNGSLYGTKIKQIKDKTYIINQEQEQVHEKKNVNPVFDIVRPFYLSVDKNILNIQPIKLITKIDEKKKTNLVLNNQVLKTNYKRSLFFSFTEKQKQICKANKKIPIFMKSLINKFNKKQSFLKSKNINKKGFHTNYNQKISLFFNKINQMFSRRYYYKQIKEKLLVYKTKKKKYIDNARILVFSKISDSYLIKNKMNNDYKLNTLEFNKHYMQNKDENLLLSASHFLVRAKYVSLFFLTLLRKTNKNLYLSAFLKNKYVKKEEDKTPVLLAKLINKVQNTNKEAKQKQNTFFLFFKLFRYGLNFSVNSLINNLYYLKEKWLSFFLKKKPITFSFKNTQNKENRKSINITYSKSKNILNLYLKKYFYFSLLYCKAKVQGKDKKILNSVKFFNFDPLFLKKGLLFSFLRPGLLAKLIKLAIEGNRLPHTGNKDQIYNIKQNKKKNKHNYILFKQKLITYKKINKIGFTYINNLYENNLSFQRFFKFSYNSIASLAYSKKKSKNQIEIAKKKETGRYDYQSKSIKKNNISRNKTKNFVMPFFSLYNTINKKKIKAEKLHKKATLLKNIEKIHIFLAEKRKIQVGDKMAGRHGNKGIVSKILPIQDMPFLPDGTSIDMVLNPLGVPSRMNVGQIYECLLGLAGKFLGENYKITCFDEIYGPEASRSFVFNKLYEARIKTGFKWLFDPNSPGKIRIYDGRNGECFDQKITVGQAYILRLVHMVDDKIHCLTPDHDVLTTDGWIPIDKITLKHQIATLEPKTSQLIYQKPLNIFHYPNYNGELYHIKTANINLLATLNHRMYVKKGGIHDTSFTDFELIEAKHLIGKCYTYLKKANWAKNDYQFFLPAILSEIPEKKVNMDDWLTFFGIWITNGWQMNNKIKTILKKMSPLLPKKKLSISSFPSLSYDKGKETIIKSHKAKQFAFAQKPFFLKNSNNFNFRDQGICGAGEFSVERTNLELKKKTDSFFSVNQHKSQNLKNSRKTKFVLNLAKKSLFFYFLPSKLQTKKYKLLIFNKKNPFFINTLYKNPNKNFYVYRKNDYCFSANFKNKYKSFDQVQIYQCKDHVTTILTKTMASLGFKYTIINNTFSIFNKQLWSYLNHLSLGAFNKYLPSWVWQLSQSQAQKLIYALCLNKKKCIHTSLSYKTSSLQLADDIMRLALHAGWSANKNLIVKNKINDSNIDKKWCISIIQENNNPVVNNGHYYEQKYQKEEIVSYKGSVHCLNVPNEIFYVRRYGIPIWTGNSRSTGPYSLVTQQPLRGRSKQGGQRLGEMEVWALEGYGAAFTLLEMLTIKSDDMTGRMTLWSNLILNKDISIGTPESFKVLICELQALCLDIGLFRYNNINKTNSNNNLREITNLINLP